MGKVAKAGKVCKTIKHGFVMFVATNRIYDVSQRIFTTVLSRDKKAIFTYKPRLSTSEYSLSRKKKSHSKLSNLTSNKGFFKTHLRLALIQLIYATKTPSDILKHGYSFLHQRVIHATQATLKINISEHLYTPMDK